MQFMAMENWENALQPGAGLDHYWNRPWKYRIHPCVRCTPAFALIIWL